MTWAAAHHDRRTHERRGDPPPSTEQLLRDAHVVLANCGVHMGHSRLCRLVRTYERTVRGNGWAFFDYLATAMALTADAREQAMANPEVARIIGYADPTGEQAVAHVMQQRGQR